MKFLATFLTFIPSSEERARASTHAQRPSDDGTKGAMPRPLRRETARKARAFRARRLLCGLIPFIFIASAISAANSAETTDFTKITATEVVLKADIAGVKITLLSEKINGQKIKTRELDYFKKLVFASVKYFPKFREERFPKNSPLKKRGGEELTIIVIGSGKIKSLVAVAVGYPASSYDSFDGMFLNKDYAKEKTIILCSDSARFYNFIINGSTVIHEFFHYQVDLYGEFMARELEEQLAKEFETYVFFKLE